MSTETDRQLEDAVAIKRRDPGKMLDKINGFADQMSTSWGLSRSLELSERAHRTASAVAVLGMGGSAVCGDLVRAIFSDRLTVPIVSVRDYELPAWVGPTTLVVAVSHSGATEETLACLGTALERRCPVAVITTGGPLGDVAARVDLPRLVYPNETPPRASLGYTMLALAGLLERAGMLALTDAEVAAGVEAARSVATACAVDVDTSGNLAKQIAWSLLDRLPVIEGSGFLAAVARRWKTQLNENANSTATAEELPEATHNTVVGYDQPETLRDHHYMVFLEGSGDNPRNARRARLSRDMLDAIGTAQQRVVFDQSGRFTKACAAIALGDYVSFYLAMLYGVDPSATPALTVVKQTLAAFDQTDGDD
ncbi:MAG: glucose/mannose-6-phosphate isomerase [Chloroflexota bacterium]|jgi:glucose/mannose-6-phosphate isomerase|nr:glucose/mannose-6-phosphate isomerase [Chloroflexota bacterium]